MVIALDRRIRPGTALLAGTKERSLQCQLGLLVPGETCSRLIGASDVTTAKLSNREVVRG